LPDRRCVIDLIKSKSKPKARTCFVAVSEFVRGKGERERKELERFRWSERREREREREREWGNCIRQLHANEEKICCAVCCVQHFADTRHAEYSNYRRMLSIHCGAAMWQRQDGELWAWLPAV